MSATPSPTPSEDNRRNIRDETAIQAIDEAMKTYEQSQDDLLNSFIFLKKADVDKHNPKDKKTLTHDVMKNIMAKMQPAGQKPRLGTLSSESRQKVEAKLLKVDRDGIEEETLDEVSSGQLSCARVITGNRGTSLKVDNYVDADDAELDHPEGIEDLDPDLTEGYVASFGQESNNVSRLKDSLTFDNRPANVANKHPKVQANLTPADFTTSLCPDDNSTDKLLLNFLADLQNDQNNQNELKGQKPTTRTEESSEDSIEAFLQRNKKSEETIDFSDDGDAAALSLVDNSSQENLKVLVNHEELNEITKVENPVDELPPKLKPKLVMDSEDNMSEDLNNTDCVEPTDEVSGVVFPGEIVEEEISVHHKNDRLLEFKVTCKPSSELISQTDDQGKEQSTSDDVEPFHLDEDFDYDNVVLTPKYSQSDMERLQKLFQTNTAVV